MNETTKSRRRKFLTIILVVLLALSICLLAACNKGGDPSEETDDPTETTTDENRIKNSDFSRSDTEEGVFPRVPLNWTSTNPSNLPQYADGKVVAGIVDANPTVYNSHKSKWGDKDSPGVNKIPNPDKPSEKIDPEDTNMLMIYNKEPSVFYYTSSSFSVTAGYVYKISVDVKTIDIAANGGVSEGTTATPGAVIYVSSNTYAEIKEINTNGAWETYTIYLAGNVSSSSSVSLVLGLGRTGTSTTDADLTKGYAFFDNIRVEELIGDNKSLSEKAKGDSGVSIENEYRSILEQQYESGTPDSKVAVANFRGVGNGSFEFGASTVAGSSFSNTAPYLFSSLQGGTEDGDEDNYAPTTAAGRKYGKYDLTSAAWDSNVHKIGVDTYILNDGKAEKSNTAVQSFKNNGNPVGGYLGEDKSMPDNYALMLAQNTMTAQGMQARTKITIERGKWYNLTIRAYTQDILGSGITMKLKGGDEDIIINAKANALVSTRGDNNGWAEYNFWIAGSQTRSITYTLELWLGTGGKADNELVSGTDVDVNADDYVGYKYDGTVTEGALTKVALESAYKVTTDDGGKVTSTFAQGWAFFDGIMLKEYSDGTEYEKSYDDNNANPNYAFKSLYAENLLEAGLFGNAVKDDADAIQNGTEGLPVGWDYDSQIDEDSDPRTVNGVGVDGVISGAIEIPANANDWATTPFKGVEYPGLPFNYYMLGGDGSPDITQPVNSALVIHNPEGVSTIFKYKSGNITINSNAFYRLSIWVKTADIKSTSGIYLYLYEKNSDPDKDDTLLSSYTAINTAEYENAKTNDWLELVFKIQGSSKADDPKNLYIVMGTGTGDRFTPSTIADGTAFFAYGGMESLSYTDYNSISTGTYTKAHSFATTTSGTFSNGAFDNVNLDGTEGINKDTGEYTGLKEGGSVGNPDDFVQYFSKPQNFSLSDTTYDPAKLLAGIINVENETLLTNLGILDDFWTGGKPSIYDDWKVDSTSGRYNGSPNLLMIRTVGTGNPASLGYKSDNFSLSASTYYKLTVWVKTLGGGKASLYLGTESPASNNRPLEFLDITTEDGGESEWTPYYFYVKVGLNSISNINLSLWLGQNADKAESGVETKSEGTVLFDSVTLSQITAEDFNAIAEDATDAVKLVFDTDGFDTIASSDSERSGVTSPTNWTGAKATDATASYTVSGVVDVTQLDYYDTFGLKESDKDADGNLFSAEQIEKSKLPTNIKPPQSSSIYENKRMLVINNKQASGYAYTSSSYSFAANGYYVVKVWAMTYGIEDENLGAHIFLKLGDNTRKFEGINTGVSYNGWTEYAFYVSTSKTAVSATIVLGLGQFLEDIDATGFISGYALFDNVYVSSLTEAEYKDTVGKNEEGKYTNAEYAALVEAGRAQDYALGSSEDIDNGDDEEEEEEETNVSNPNDLMWLWISSIVLGVVIIVVLVVYFVRKFYKPRKKGPEGEPSYSKDIKTSESIEEKEEKYRDFED